MLFDFSQCSEHDSEIALRYLGSLYRPADLVISPDGSDKPYLWRWHLVKAPEASVYFHIQVADDPERPLHDHPYDNMSVILAGGYREILDRTPFHTHSSHGAFEGPQEYKREVGDVVFRDASWAHRLFLPHSHRYTMTQFSCGPRIRKWGFWFKDGWRAYDSVTQVTDEGVSVFRDDVKEELLRQ